MNPRAQAVAVAVIGLADLCTTIYFVTHCGASEANPLMASALERGISVFVQLKLFLIIGPLVLLEWARRRSPQFVRTAMNVCISLYVGLYLFGVASVNRSPDGLAATARITQEEVEAQRRELGLSPGRPLPNLSRQEG